MITNDDAQHKDQLTTLPKEILLKIIENLQDSDRINLIYNLLKLAIKNNNVTELKCLLSPCTIEDKTKLVNMQTTSCSITLYHLAIQKFGPSSEIALILYEFSISDGYSRIGGKRISTTQLLQQCGQTCPQKEITSAQASVLRDLLMQYRDLFYPGGQEASRKIINFCFQNKYINYFLIRPSLYESKSPDFTFAVTLRLPDGRIASARYHIQNNGQIKEGNTVYSSLEQAFQSLQKRCVCVPITRSLIQEATTKLRLEHYTLVGTPPHPLLHAVLQICTEEECTTLLNDMNQYWSDQNDHPENDHRNDQPVQYIVPTPIAVTPSVFHKPPQTDANPRQKGKNPFSSLFKRQH